MSVLFSEEHRIAEIFGITSVNPKVFAVSFLVPVSGDANEIIVYSSRYVYFK